MAIVTLKGQLMAAEQEGALYRDILNRVLLLAMQAEAKGESVPAADLRAALDPWGVTI